jgi:ABC-type dipeptide/oligopeptide/nickel transport system permease subunit
VFTNAEVDRVATKKRRRIYFQGILPEVYPALIVGVFQEFPECLIIFAEVLRLKRCLLLCQ